MTRARELTAMADGGRWKVEGGGGPEFRIPLDSEPVLPEGRIPAVIPEAHDPSHSPQITAGTADSRPHVPSLPWTPPHRREFATASLVRSGRS